MMDTPTTTTVGNTGEQSRDKASLLPFGIYRGVGTTTANMPGDTPVIPTRTGVIRSVQLAHNGEQTPVTATETVLAIVVKYSNPELAPPTEPEVGTAVDPNDTRNKANTPVDNSRTKSNPT